MLFSSARFDRRGKVEAAEKQKDIIIINDHSVLSGLINVLLLSIQCQQIVKTFVIISQS